VLAGEMGGEGERPVQARLSNFHHYAVTGVKAQAFVRCLFYLDPIYHQLYQQHQCLVEVSEAPALLG
jgi:hypothetical protein